MRKINWGKIGRIFALVPVGITTVMGTIYMTNTSKPISSLTTLEIIERPELEEELLIPKMPPPQSKGSNGESSTSQETGEASKDSEKASTNEESEGSKKEDNTEKKEEKENSEKSSESKTSAEKGLSSTQGIVNPEEMLKKIITSINSLNIQQVKGKMVDLFNLLHALKQGSNAALIIQLEKLKNQEPSQIIEKSIT